MMASAGDVTARANIRIEIKNDLSEEMDVDTAEENTTLSEGEVEDGEINDAKESDETQTSQTKKLFSRNAAANRTMNQWPNSDGGFTTGVDIFAKDEQEKLHTRAQRFGLDPVDCKSMTDKQLQDLHDSLGITVDDETDTRFEAIHMYGTQEMSTQDVFGYFGKYGPASIEWINDVSCNVVWLDRISAARALHFLSRPLEGVPVTGRCNPFMESAEADEELDEKVEEVQSEDQIKGRSILLISKDREVELYDENPEVEEQDELKKQTITHVSEIDMAIPPGFWRLGDPHPKAKHLLFRFAKRTDRKPYKAERFSEYYKKYGNPNFGGMRGLISESKKKRMKVTKSVENDDKDPEEEVVSGNPWGSLAKNWNRDSSERPESNLRANFHNKPSKSILDRLGEGSKRPHPASEGEEAQNEKKSKVPRMRMYADEEEARLEKAKQLKKIRELEKIEEMMTDPKIAQKVPDLRNRIGRQTLVDRLPLEAINRLTGARTRPLKQETSKTRISHSDDEELNVQQRSKVTVIVKKQTKPTVASTIWSRLDKEEKRRQKRRESLDKKSESDSDSKSSRSDSSDSESDSDDDEKYDSSVRNKISKALNQRPGFNRDLKARLGLSKDHKSPLRIEINNDHYKKS